MCAKVFMYHKTRNSKLSCLPAQQLKPYCPKMHCYIVYATQHTQLI